MFAKFWSSVWSKSVFVGKSALGECFAPSLAGLKPLEQPEPQVIGPPASGTLRPKNDFLKKVLGTPAQTALGSTSP